MISDNTNLRKVPPKKQFALPVRANMDQATSTCIDGTSRIYKILNRNEENIASPSLPRLNNMEEVLEQQELQQIANENETKRQTRINEKNDTLPFLRLNDLVPHMDYYIKPVEFTNQVSSGNVKIFSLKDGLKKDIMFESIGIIEMPFPMVGKFSSATLYVHPPQIQMEMFKNLNEELFRKLMIDASLLRFLDKFQSFLDLLTTDRLRIQLKKGGTFADNYTHEICRTTLNGQTMYLSDMCETLKQLINKPIRFTFNIGLYVNIDTQKYGFFITTRNITIIDLD